jgi:hypothetical protein
MKSVTLVRTAKNDVAIYGILTVTEGDSVEFVCLTIENKDKSFPAGKYSLKLEFSPRFKKDLWELFGIPGRGEIKIHVANFWNQLEGCIGVGRISQDLNQDAILDLGQSKIALEDFMVTMGDQKEAEITVLEAYSN